MLNKVILYFQKALQLITKLAVLSVALLCISIGVKLAKEGLNAYQRINNHLASRAENANPPIINAPPIMAPLYIPVIAIGNSGRTNCTAFVISVNYALTAAHCVEVGDSYEVFAIRSDNQKFVALKNTTATAVSSYFRAGLDMAALHGDFRDFETIPVIENKNQIEYPQGISIGLLNKQLVIEPILFVGPNIFGLAAEGQIFPGMSGGPVIDERGVAVGINSAMAPNFVIISPLHLWKHYLNIN